MEQALSNRIANFRLNAARVEQTLENERRSILRLNTRVTSIKEENIELVKAVTLLDRCIEVVSANGIGKIENIVSAGMHKVFQDDTLSLVVDKKETARGYSYRLLIRHGDTLGDPMESFGGGVQNVVAFLLRLILIKRFKLAKLLVVDENFNNVSSEYIPNLSALLKFMAEVYGFTIFAVTHQPKLASAAQNVYEVVPIKPPILRKLNYASISGDENDREEDKDGNNH